LKILFFYLLALWSFEVSHILKKTVLCSSPNMNLLVLYYVSSFSMTVFFLSFNTVTLYIHLHDHTLNIFSISFVIYYV
jgi:hypothetical protein